MGFTKITTKIENKYINYNINEIKLRYSLSHTLNINENSDPVFAKTINIYFFTKKKKKMCFYI